MKKITMRDLVKDYPEFYYFDYKWRDSKNYRDLNELLSEFGYVLHCGEIEAGDYNDIKGYFGCPLKEI